VGYLEWMKRTSFVLFLLVITLSFSCDDKTTPTCRLPTQTKGFALSPQGFPTSYDRLVQFYEDVESFKDGAVMWNGAWRDDAVEGEDAGTVPEGASSVQDAAIQYCFMPIAVFGWRNGDTNLIQIPAFTTNDWSNTQARAKFVSMLVAFVNQYRPPYVFLGNENDFYYESNPTDYGNWLSAYNQAYDAIKEVSETTKIGPVFNFEHMSGQGILNAWNTQYWQAIEEHDLDRVDVVGLSVYPFFNYETPADVPSNYLNPLFERIGNRPVVITETGWPAQNLGALNPQWETSEEAQVEYVTRLQAFTNGKDIPVMNWLFLNGMVDDGTSSDQWKIFGSVSIRNKIGIEYQVYEPWLDL
jgi:hypothetical protein